jgi:hypothetical protein
MATVVYIIACVFVVMSFGTLMAFVSSRHLGTLLGSISYGAGGVGAIYLATWWPLVAGFLAALLLRSVGGDPGYSG